MGLDFDDPDLYLTLDEPEVLTIGSEGPGFIHADQLGFVNLTVDQSMVGDHVVTYTVTDREGLTASVEVSETTVESALNALVRAGIHRKSIEVRRQKSPPGHPDTEKRE